MTDSERSAKFQAHIQTKINDLKVLQTKGADPATSQTMIEKFEAVGKLDLANLFLKNLINSGPQVSDERQREKEHLKLLEHAEEIESLNAKNLFEGGIGNAFLRLASTQFQNEVRRIADKVQKG